jgi:hypothetical protein
VQRWRAPCERQPPPPPLLSPPQGLGLASFIRRGYCDYMVQRAHLRNNLCTAFRRRVSTRRALLDIPFDLPSTGVRALLLAGWGRHLHLEANGAHVWRAGVHPLRPWFPLCTEGADKIRLWMPFAATSDGRATVGIYTCLPTCPSFLLLLRIASARELESIYCIGTAWVPGRYEIHHHAARHYVGIAGAVQLSTQLSTPDKDWWVS